MKFFTIFNNYRNNIFIFSIFIISLIIESCGTSYVSVPVKKPAEVNMSAYRQMTVGKFVNSYKGYYEEHKYDDYIPSKIINALTSSKMVEVVDRENLDKVLAEKGLSVEGLVGGKSGQAGNIIPATALITGTVLINDFREETKDNSYTDKGKRYTS